IAVWFVHKLHNNFLGIVAIHVNDAVIPDVLYRFRVQFSAQYLHVGIRKILNIIAFFTQRFVVSINQTLYRAYKRLLLVVLYKLDDWYYRVVMWLCVAI